MKISTSLSQKDINIIDKNNEFCIYSNVELPKHPNQLFLLITPILERDRDRERIILFGSFPLIC